MGAELLRAAATRAENALRCGMVSIQHEGLVLLFRNRPEMVVGLLRDQLGVKLPEYETATVVEADITEVTPTERKADLVVVLEGPLGKLAVVVEVQLAWDGGKLWSWPQYLAGLRGRLKCPVLLLVVTPDESVARQAAMPIELGPGSAITPKVLLASAVPEVLDAEAARRNPELAVLSVMGHAAAGNVLELAKVALGALGGLDDDRARTYADLMLAVLPEAARRAMEALMQSGYEYQSDFAKKYVAQGRQEGEAAGEAHGKAAAVLAVLRARGIAVDAAAEQRIAECMDLAQLDRWITEAVKVTRVAELFTSEKHA